MNPVFDLGPGRWGAASGLLLATGLLLVARHVLARRRPTLEARVAPYLIDTVGFTRLRQREVIHPAGVLAVLGRPLVRDSARIVERLLGGAESVRARLVRAGRAPDVDRFRAEQVLAGAAGAALGGAAGVVLAVRGDGGVVLLLWLTALGAMTGVVAWDQLLTRTVTRREQRMLAEFPTVAELLALAVGAGEGAVGALERVSRRSRGDLATELGRCLADARAGANLPRALTGLAKRTGSTSLSRFVDGVVVAVERGTPLADVLRAQAQDVREEGRRQLMETGGKKEISMMIPVVFLILPVTILFAAYPGFDFLNFSM